MRCQRQILDVCWWVHVSNAEVLRRSGLSPIVTSYVSYVIDAYLCLAMLHAWTLEYQHVMLCIWWWIPIRQKGQLEKTAGSPSQRLAQQGSGGCQRSTIYPVAIWDRQGSRSRSLVTQTFLCDDDDGDDEGWQTFDKKMEGKTIFSRHLQAVPNRDCWMFENHWRRV